MNKMRAKRRLLGVCRLQAKLTQRDLIHAQSKTVRLEMSHAQMLDMADDMLGTLDCSQSAILASRLEFGHRLITLSSVQKMKIAEAKQIAVRLRSSAHIATLREERAELYFRRARNTHDQRLLENQPHRIGQHGIASMGSKKGFSS